MSLRDCLKLQRVEQGYCINVTTFGRALLVSGLPWGEGDYMLYWLKLPIFGHYWDILRNRQQWGQRVLFWHGKDGFSLWWTEAEVLFK